MILPYLAMTINNKSISRYYSKSIFIKN